MHPTFVDLQQDLDAAQREAGMLEQARLRCATVVAGSDDPVTRWIHVNAVASGIEKVYGGIEKALVRIARSVDRHVPEGADWHVTLLRRMAHPFPQRRPAVLSTASADRLDALRAFRHRERHSYVADLEPDRVVDIAASVPAALAGVLADVASFRSYMESA
jgi:hypothetical protein